MIESLETTVDNAVAFKLSGKLHDEDYKLFTMASIEYFDVHEIDAAWKWLAE